MKNVFKHYKEMKALSPSGAANVIDTSFIWTGIRGRFSLGDEDALDKVRAESEFTDCLATKLKDDCFFVSETAQEFDERTRRMEKWAYRAYGHSMFDLGDGLIELVEKRIDFSQRVMSNHSMERLIPEESGLYLPHIRNAAVAICDIPGIMKSQAERKRQKAKLAHIHNDAGLFSKGVALSYTRPVVIGTRDPDFVRMAEEFYSGDYSLRYGFPIPKNDVIVLFRERNRASVFSRGEFQREVKLALA